THFTNAVVEGKDLLPTGVVRLCGSATRALPPTIDWPERLAAMVGDAIFLCQGGQEYDGRVIADLDEAELLAVAEEIAHRGIKTVAITSVFSPVDGAMERRAAEIMSTVLPGASFTLSSEIGRIGLLERENAAIVNACLLGLADRIISGLSDAVARFGIEAPVYLSQNDGTLMSAAYTNRYPVATFASGPTNSMRGAAHLSGQTDCAVIDIGGTTSDIGILHHGFPREASTAVTIGGVRTNFRMPDVLSIGIGGGSIVRTDPDLTVGPDSVGYRLTKRALVFGGDVLTSTDVAVAAGLAEIGNPELVTHLDRGMVTDAIALISGALSEALDRMKTAPEPIPVVLVGGGSVLVGDSLPGASNVIRPAHFSVANAIGAGIAQVGGQVDLVVSLDETPRERALDAARADAAERCRVAGADPATVRIVEVDEVPLAYLPSNVVRIRVKAVGDLRIGEDHADHH
ncbi:MAG TPA: hydantoinase/oxoprolinase family protein, partial [Acidimicrobiia bacterium]|nr:hydantoinase/oxoprolinase family protein [Acidimicrobiia bacterium]